MAAVHCTSSCLLAQILSERDRLLGSRESATTGVAKTVKGVRINCDPLDAYTLECTALPPFLRSVRQLRYDCADVPDNHPIFDTPEVQYVPVADVRDCTDSHLILTLDEIFPHATNIQKTYAHSSRQTGHHVFPVNVSPLGISKLIELPILLWEYPQAEVRTCGCSDHQNVFPPWDNMPATHLCVNVDPTREHFGFLKMCTTEVLAVREDRKLLLPFHMKALCSFCEMTVVPLIKDYLEPKARVRKTVKDVMRSITKSDFQKFLDLHYADTMDQDPSSTSPYEV